MWKLYARIHWTDWTVGVTWGVDRRSFLKTWRYACVHVGPLEAGLEKEM